MDPIKYLFEKPTLTGRTARWLLLLSKFDITYITQKSIKGQAVVDHLVFHPTKGERILDDAFSDEEIASAEEETINKWKLYFNGASDKKGCGARVLLVTPDGLYLPSSFHIDFPCTNEYVACALGLKIALTIGVKKIKVYGISAIFICQTQGKWKIRDEKLKPYQEHLEEVVKQFEDISFKKFQRDNNQFANALATLASMVEYNPMAQVLPFMVEEKEKPTYQDIVNALTMDGRLWFAHVIDYIMERRYLAKATEGEKKFLRKYASQFILQGDLLYKRLYDGIQLLCIDEE
ncbi:uncharacterized protein LOC122076379 [Macadamia integrifolia]|uniref:uncharacterized protein LOC122076379 n=1 Tax=Macadamia integrifolia TaxID=60698 RepID=UPI001C4E8C4E|nr:uncharacterized protein LOC122076379 [Macadamia integrifolia]